MKTQRLIWFGCLLLLPVPDLQAADAVLAMPADGPAYTLSNIRSHSGRFGGNGLAFDFRRTRKSDGKVSVSGASASGRLSISATIPASKDSGTVTLSSLFGSGSIGDVEIYLTQSYRTRDGSEHAYLVSNAIKFGNPGTNTRGATWTAQQQSDRKEFHRVMSDDSAHKFLKKYPVTVQPEQGYVFVPTNAIITKDVKLKGCYSDSWSPLTALSQNDDGTINVIWDKYGRQYDVSMTRDELTIDERTLTSLKRDPSIKDVPHAVSSMKFPTKLDKLPKKDYAVSIPVPADSVVVPANAEIPEGTPLRACYAGKWNPLTAIKAMDDGTISVHWNDYGSGSDCRMDRRQLIVNRSLIGMEPASPIDIDPSDEPLTAPLKFKNYTVSIPAPPTSDFVPPKVRLKAGTPLQACYAGRWNPITLLSCNTDGTLNIRWDDYGSGFDCSMARDQLIVSKALLKQAMQRSKDSDTPSSALRTWVDSTGKFRVKAKFISKTDAAVTIETENGLTKTLPISKLSTADQQYLQTMSTSENPFD